MTEQATTSAVRHEVTVPIDRERAFKLFTEEIGTWWPSEHYSILEGPTGESGAQMRAQVGSEGGWPALMKLYAEEAAR